MPSTADAFQISSKIWFVWGIVWLLMAAWSKPSKRREFPWQRLEHVIPLVIGFLLIYNHRFAWNFLADRIILLDRGNIVAMRPVEEVRNSQHPRVRQFLDRIADSAQDDDVDHLRMFTEGIR